MTVRMRDEKGSVVIGLVRGKLLDRLLAGERVCLPGYTDSNGVHHPHVCLFVRDDNRQLMRALDEYFPGGLLPGAVREHAGPEIE